MKNFYGRRRILKLAGWRHIDRVGTELWVRPIENNNQNYISFKAAWEAYIKTSQLDQKPLIDEIIRLEKERNNELELPRPPK